MAFLRFQRGVDKHLDVELVNVLCRAKNAKNVEASQLQWFDFTVCAEWGLNVGVFSVISTSELVGSGQNLLACFGNWLHD
jgi:hypothetical protein